MARCHQPYDAMAEWMYGYRFVKLIFSSVSDFEGRREFGHGS
jgi:hypothetical protein